MLNVCCNKHQSNVIHVEHGILRMSNDSFGRMNVMLGRLLSVAIGGGDDDDDNTNSGGFTM